MSNNTFEIIGKLVIGKESEKFKPYESKTSEKGWTTNRLLFNVIAGDNRHMMEISGGYKKDGSGVVYTFSKKTGDDSKGEKLEIAWNDRAKPEKVALVAEFKKFIVDLEEYGRRYKLERAFEKKKEGTLTEQELVDLGVDNIELALEESKKKRKEFIAEADFSEFVHKLIASDKVKDRIFRVVGNIEDSEYNGKFYRKLVPTRLYLAEKDAQPSSTGQITVFFNKNSLDNSLLQKTNKYFIKGFVRGYDRNRKTEIAYPISLAIDTTKNETDEKVKKFNNLMVNQFTVKDKTWKELGVKVKLLDGAQKVEITPEMLTDTQKELLAMEAITMDDIRKELGKDIYGDRVQEMVIINVIKGYTSGRKDTKYVDTDFVIEPIEIKEVPKVEVETDDIFSDLPDLD